VGAEELAGIMLRLGAQGCHNINFVSPTHVVPQILEALQIAAERGLDLPIVYNTGGYDSPETLALLDGVVDIYMPDIKYADARVARRYSGIDDYPKVNQAAIIEMQRQVGDLKIDAKSGVAMRGLLVRHLVLPQGLAGTEKVVHFIAEEVSRNTYINIMTQYRTHYKAHRIPPLARSVSRRECSRALDLAKNSGLSRLDRARPFAFV
jgi:putative pyruvate formate lyase activating enzyme